MSVPVLAAIVCTSWIRVMPPRQVIPTQPDRRAIWRDTNSPEVLWKQYTTTKYSVSCRLIVATRPDVNPQRAFCYVFTSSTVHAIAFTFLTSHSEDMLWEISCKTQKINTIQAIKMHFTEQLTEWRSTARVFFRGISTEPLQRRAVISRSRHIHLYIFRSHVYCLLRRWSSEVRAYPPLQRAICAVLCFASFFRAIRDRMNNEHKRKDKEAFNKRGLEQKGGCVGGRRGEGRELKRQTKTWNIRREW